MKREKHLDRQFARFCRTHDPSALGKLFDGAAPELLRVARHLAGDRHQAEDLVQTTFVVAIEQPHLYDPAQPVLPWLLGILANRARHLRRQERRPRSPSQLDPQKSCDPAEEAERHELLETLRRSLAALPAPYREVLVLHLQHGLTAREIGEALDRPAGTVRTQIVRGLDKLRRLLPAGLASHAEAGAWLSPDMLAALRARVLDAVGATSIAGSGAAFVLGGLLMAKKMLVLTVAFAVLSTGLLITWLMMPDGGTAKKEAEELDGSRALASGTVTTTEAPPVAEIDAERLQREVVIEAAPAAGWELRATRAPASLQGQVLWDWSRVPVTGARVSASLTPGGRRDEWEWTDDRNAAVQTTETDELGMFVFEQLEEGPYRIEVEAETGEKGSALGYASTQGLPVYCVLSTMGPGATVTRAAVLPDVHICVVDEQQRRVGGAEVQLRGRGPEGRIGGDVGLKATTDAAGMALFPGVFFRGGLMTVSAPEGTCALEKLHGGFGTYLDWVLPGPVEAFVVRVAPPGCIEGCVEGDGDTSGLTIRARATHAGGGKHGPSHVEYTCTTGPEGTFQLGEIPEGHYQILVDAPLGKRQAPDGAWRGHIYPAAVDVKARAKVQVTLTLVTGVPVHGTVGDQDRSPVAGAIVRGTRGTETSWDVSSTQCRGRNRTTLLEKFVAKTDGEGRYTFPGLIPGPWVIEVTAPGLFFDRRIVIAVDGEELNLSHDLGPAGGLQGTAWTSAKLGIANAGTMPSELTLLLGPDARPAFSVPGLRPGVYDVLDMDQEGRTLATVTIEVGRLTLVELERDTGKAVIEGVVRRGAKPVWTLIGNATTTSVTDDEGRYRLALEKPIQTGARLRVCTEGCLPLRIDLPSLMGQEEYKKLDLELPDASILVHVKLPATDDRAILYLQPVSLVSELLRPPEVMSQTAGSGGQVRWSGVPAGQYKLFGGTMSGCQLPVKTLNVGPRDAVTVEVAPVRGGDLVVYVLRGGRPVEGVPVTVMSAGWGTDQFAPKPVFTDESGVAWFRNVPAGEALVGIVGRNQWQLKVFLQHEKFTLEEGQTRDLIFDVP
ncbi:MAG: sigma-70 family RNA polymerase sigma factor [Planctomycetota bacterium]